MGGNQIPGVDPTIRRTEPKHTVTEWAVQKVITKLTMNLTTSWKIKIGGFLVAVGQGLALSPEYSTYGHWLTAAGGFLLAFGRDNKTTSEQVGVK